MAAYVVTYDLMRQGQNYEGITKRLQSYPTHWHVQQSVWIVVTTQNASTIRDYLAATLDANDKLIVARLSNEAAWTGYDASVSQWLKQVLAS